MVLYWLTFQDPFCFILFPNVVLVLVVILFLIFFSWWIIVLSRDPCCSFLLSFLFLFSCCGSLLGAVVCFFQKLLLWFFVGTLAVALFLLAFALFTSWLLISALFLPFLVFFGCRFVFVVLVCLRTDRPFSKGAFFLQFQR